MSSLTDAMRRQGLLKYLTDLSIDYEILCECGNDTARISSVVEGVIKSVPCENCSEEEKAAFIPKEDEVFFEADLKCTQCGSTSRITDKTMLKVKEAEL